MPLRICEIEGCGRPVKGRLWCTTHYERWRQHGDPLAVLSNYGKSPEERYLLWTDKNGPVPDHRPDLGPCWLWTGHVDTNGYGIIKVDGKNRKVHRWSYEHHVGPIPPGLDPDHLCRVEACSRPTHLEPVTPGENQRRGLNGELKTHCRNGHPYTAENVKLNTYGKRHCIICTAAAQKRHRDKKRAERMVSSGTP